MNCVWLAIDEAPVEAFIATMLLIAWFFQKAREPCQVSSQQNLTLTDQERAAIAWAAGLSDTRPSGCRTTLRSLLERASKSTADGQESDQ